MSETPFRSILIVFMAYNRHHAAAATSPDSSPTSDNESGGGGGGGGGGDGQSRKNGNYIREQDRLLPIANVGRIMKRALPGNAKISKDAKETVQECVSEFISFITGEASDKCQREKRKTVNGDDLLWGMTTLGFEDYVEPLRIYLNKYRELEGERSSMAAPPKPGDQQQQQLQVNGSDPHAYGHSPHGPMAYHVPGSGGAFGQGR